MTSFDLRLVIVSGEGPSRLEIGAERDNVSSDEIDEAVAALGLAVSFELARRAGKQAGDKAND